MTSTDAPATASLDRLNPLRDVVHRHKAGEHVGLTSADACAAGPTTEEARS